MVAANQLKRSGTVSPERVLSLESVKYSRPVHVEELFDQSLGKWRYARGCPESIVGTSYTHLHRNTRMRFVAHYLKIFRLPPIYAPPSLPIDLE